MEGTDRAHHPVLGQDHPSSSQAVESIEDPVEVVGTEEGVDLVGRGRVGHGEGVGHHQHADVGPDQAPPQGQG